MAEWKRNSGLFEFAPKSAEKAEAKDSWRTPADDETALLRSDGAHQQERPYQAGQSDKWRKPDNETVLLKKDSSELSKYAAKHPEAKGWQRKSAPQLEPVPKQVPAEQKTIVEQKISWKKEPDTTQQVAKDISERARDQWVEEEEDNNTVVLANPGVVSNVEQVVRHEEPETKIYPVFIRKKTGERFVVNKPICVIGRDPNTADFAIRDNHAISRKHAEIIERNGQYYLHDTKSANHTYIDQVRLPDNQEKMLTGNQKIVLANEEFSFECE